MNTILERKYNAEKQAFTKLLIESRMLEITYSETFNLIFYKDKNIGGDDYKWIVQKMNLIIDAPFWVGEKSKWEECMKDDKGIISMDDNMLAYELVNIIYNNFIQVHKVEFLEKYLCISLDNDRILSIAYCSDSDYSWILEEYSDKNQQEKMAVFCQGNEIFAKNISEII
ncbi:MAG: hypothetical protein K2N51_17300 [Lachnospiraceae bacterium]|nr:hypothetical protein [Lachnospiraceae bacterium]